MSNNNIGSFLLGTVLGAVAGGVAALLLSPGSGTHNRKILAKTISQGQKYVGKKYHEAQEFAEDVYDEVSDQATHVLKDAEKRIKPLQKEASRFAVRALDTADDKIKETKDRFFRGVKS